MGWIGVDLDKTLAHYTEWADGHVGEPIMPMVKKVRNLLAQGKEVRIFTARISHPLCTPEHIKSIEDWCLEHLGKVLPVTNAKDWECEELWDDIAQGVRPNKGLFHLYGGRHQWSFA